MVNVHENPYNGKKSYTSAEENPTQIKEFPAGVYKPNIIETIFGEDMMEIHEIVSVEKYVTPNSGTHTKVLNTIVNYFTPEVEKIHSKLEVAHKLGMMLYGKPGTGKTVLAQIIAEKLVKEYGAIVLWCDGDNTSALQFYLKQIRKRNPETLVILMYDEFDSLVTKQESSLLRFLDGADSPNKFVFLGITNYIDKIPDRIKKRKSRIKHVFNLDKLDKAVYEDIIKEKLAIFQYDDKVIGDYVKKCHKDQMTIDDVKHFLLDSEIAKIKG